MYIQIISSGDAAKIKFNYKLLKREHGGIVVERPTPNREVLGSISTSVTMLCP